MRAAAYVRCSTTQQEDSPEQQRKEIEGFAREQGLEIIEWYVDFGKSGTTFDQRPEFQRLKCDVETGPSFRFVICYDESRWGRSIIAGENTYWRVHFQRHGVEVVLVKTSVDPEHEAAPLLETLEGMQASQYSRKLSELTLRGQKSNGVFSSGGSAPYAYQRIAVDMKTGQERILPDGSWCVKKQEKVRWALGKSHEIETVRFIFEERSRGLAYVVIARMLNERGTPCPRRGKWRSKDQKWSSGTIKAILENPAYRGSRVYNRYSSSRIVARKKGREQKSDRKAPVWRNDKADWIVTENAHPAIVSRELWEKANSAGRQKVNAHQKPRYKSRYLLTGLIRCSKCGFAFQGWSGRAGGREYLRYIDGGWQSKRVCDFYSIPRDYLEGFALRSVRETLADSAITGRIEEHLKMLYRAAPSERDKEMHRAAAELAVVERKIQNLLDLVEDGSVVGRSIRERLAELEEKRMGIKQDIASLESQDRARDLPDTAQLVRQFVENFEAEFVRASQEERKLLIQKCIERILIDREHSIARFYVRELPAVTPEIAKALKSHGSESLVVSCQSARNRTPHKNRAGLRA